MEIKKVTGVNEVIKWTLLQYDCCLRRGNWDIDTHGKETRQRHREEKTIIIKTRREASGESNLTDSLDLGLVASRTVRKLISVV